MTRDPQTRRKVAQTKPRRMPTSRKRAESEAKSIDEDRTDDYAGARTNESREAAPHSQPKKHESAGPGNRANKPARVSIPRLCSHERERRSRNSRQPVGRARERPPIVRGRSSWRKPPRAGRKASRWRCRHNSAARREDDDTSDSATARITEWSPDPRLPRPPNAGQSAPACAPRQFHPRRLKGFILAESRARGQGAGNSRALAHAARQRRGSGFANRQRPTNVINCLDADPRAADGRLTPARNIPPRSATATAKGPGRNGQPARCSVRRWLRRRSR